MTIGPKHERNPFYRSDSLKRTEDNRVIEMHHIAWLLVVVTFVIATVGTVLAAQGKWWWVFPLVSIAAGAGFAVGCAFEKRNELRP